MQITSTPTAQNHTSMVATIVGLNTILIIYILCIVTLVNVAMEYISPKKLIYSLNENVTTKGCNNPYNSKMIHVFIPSMFTLRLFHTDAHNAPHTHTRTHSHTLTLTHTHTRTHSHTLTLTHTHTHTHTHIHCTHSHSHSLHTHTLTLTPTHTHTYTHSHSHSLHTHTHSHSHSHTLTLTHTHTHTHSRSHTLTLTHTDLCHRLHGHISNNYVFIFDTGKCVCQWVPSGTES